MYQLIAQEIKETKGRHSRMAVSAYELKVERKSPEAPSLKGCSLKQSGLQTIHSRMVINDS